MKVQGIECPLCSEQLWSKWGHDFHYCGCGYCFVDGGRNYLRYGWGIPNNTEVTAQIGVPQMVTIETGEKDV